MKDSINPLGAAAWRRGALLGLQWTAVLFVMTLALYGLLGIIGWSGVARALCAMGAGPVLGGAGIAVWWLIRRPALVPAESVSAKSTKGGGSSTRDDHDGGGTGTP
ncbi:MAG: hypothetical protein JXQ72_17375 [Anaerolineae bacterium]|nr:hypothetical protein [Anaerolineae bacterium]